MDKPEELRAAIADLDRRQKKLINQIKHYRKLTAESQAKVDSLTAEVTEVQDTWLDLIGRLREAEEDE